MGFLPAWHAPGASGLGVFVVYARHFRSSLPECPLAVTPNGAYLQAVVPPVSAWGAPAAGAGRLTPATTRVSA